MSTTTPVEIPFVEGEDLHLRLAMSACRVRVRPGADAPLAVGTYHDPTGGLPLKTLQDGSTVTVTQGRELAGFLGLVSGSPVLELSLGTARPYDLTVEGGAIDVELDLGGLPLRSVTTRHGAGKVDLDFSAPHPSSMDKLSLSVGAGGLEAERLGNANSARIDVEGGAAGYELDFTGDQRQVLTGRVQAAMSGVELRLPRQLAVRVTTSTVLGGLDLGDGFVTRDGAVWNTTDTAAAPRIALEVSVAMGGLKLRLAP